jgi:ParB-like chromosome segregation protein Spo0J
MNESAYFSVPSRLSVTYRPLAALIPDPRNARTHPKRQIDQIRQSIKAFGFTNPILTDPEGHIIADHGRLQAARLMGFAEVPVITPSGLSETQKRALRIADNKIALNAGWDLEILQLELRELTSIDVDFDLTLTGFSTGEIDVILASTADPDDEIIPPAPVTPRTKQGDIWILGDHRVGCGDGRRKPSRVRHGLGRDERSGIPFVPCRHVGRRSARLARWRRPLRLHGLAAHGRRLRRRPHGL